ncbi:NAD(P)/FAD-dependent oxidoreductase [Saccharothrix deserti]|uniref:NAD(P)/FAD-dependent oxidoreductase n=1 Tax=Saccharothrix deserti TaxID=2593674 RepID=UPI00131BD5B9|nr:FAD-dependent oxidoreductase [Saccharothrix deserti]
MRAVVLGAGPTGLMAAMLLAAEGHRVTVLDRDASPPDGDAGVVWSGWKRPGVNQFHHTHCLLPGGLHMLAAEVPAIVDRLIGLGGRRHNMIGGAWGVGQVGGREPEDDRFGTVAVRRPLLEAAVLAEAEQTAGVTLRRGVRVIGLLTEAGTAGQPHVTGVRTGDGELAADLVVDASGRNSQVTAMLAAIGAEPHEQRAEVGFRYYTRFFRSADGVLPRRLPWPNQHHDSLTVLTAPGDSGTWSVTLATSGRDQELRGLGHNDAWQRALALYPAAAHWGDGEPITNVTAMGGTESRYRSFVVDGRPVATGIVALGDAWATINPQFGTGMTMGFRHAALLRNTLRMVGVEDPVEFAVRFHAATEHNLSPVWTSFAAWDGHRFAEIDAEMRGEVYTTDDPAWNLQIALDTARRHAPDVLRALADVACMLTTTEEALAKPGPLEKILELGAGAPRYPDPGPTRAELLSALTRD